jgi:chromosome segregation ATPase
MKTIEEQAAKRAGERRKAYLDLARVLAQIALTGGDPPPIEEIEQIVGLAGYSLADLTKDVEKEKTRLQLLEKASPAREQDIREKRDDMQAGFEKAQEQLNTYTKQMHELLTPIGHSLGHMQQQLSEIEQIRTQLAYSHPDSDRLVAAERQVTSAKDRVVELQTVLRTHPTRVADTLKDVSRATPDKREYWQNRHEKEKAELEAAQAGIHDAQNALQQAQEAAAAIRRELEQS